MRLGTGRRSPDGSTLEQAKARARAAMTATPTPTARKRPGRATRPQHRWRLQRNGTHDKTLAKPAAPKIAKLFSLAVDRSVTPESRQKARQLLARYGYRVQLAKEKT
jgi:hypothetical protein